MLQMACTVKDHKNDFNILFNNLFKVLKKLFSAVGVIMSI